MKTPSRPSPIYLRHPDGHVISCRPEAAYQFSGYARLDEDEGLRLLASQHRESGDAEYSVDVLVRGIELLAELTSGEAARCAGDARLTRAQVQKALAVLQAVERYYQ